MNDPHSGASLSWLRPWTFVALATFDGTVYFDWALRWEHGFGFLARGEWWLWTALCLGAWFACLAWLAREGAGFVRHALLAFIAFNGGFFVAGIGNPSHDWRRYPFYGGLLTDGNVGIYSRAEVLAFALSAALAHGLIGSGLKRSLTNPSPSSFGRWLGLVGAAVLLLGALLASRLIDGVGIGTTAAGLEALRRGLSNAAFSIGAILLAAAVAVTLRRRRATRI